MILNCLFDRISKCVLVGCCCGGICFASDDLDVPVPYMFDRRISEEPAGVKPESPPVEDMQKAGDVDLEEKPMMNAEPVLSAVVEETIEPLEKKSGLRVLDVSALERMALENSGLLISRQASVHVLQAEASAVNGIPDPQVRARYGDRDRGGDTGDQRSTRSGEVALRFYVPNVFSGSSLKHALLAEKDAEEAAWQTEGWSLVCDVRQLLLDIIYYENRLAFQKERLQLAETNKERINSLSKAGEITAFDAIDENLDFLREVRELDELDRKLTCATGRLILMTGIDDPDGWQLSYQRMQGIVALDDFGGLDILVQKALENRPEMQDARHRLRAAQLRLSAERRKSLPWVDFIQVGYEQNDLDNTGDTTWSVQAALNLPVISGVSGRDRRVALCGIDEAEAELAAVKQRIEREVKEAVYMLHAALKSRLDVKEQIDPVILQADRMMQDASTERYDESEMNRFARRLLDAQIVQLDAEHALRSSMLNLERVTGADI